MDISGLIGFAIGMVVGSVLIAWVTSLITRGIGKVANKPEWHGWYAGLGMAFLGFVGQVLKPTAIGIGASFVGVLVVWLIAAEKSKRAG